MIKIKKNHVALFLKIKNSTNKLNFHIARCKTYFFNRGVTKIDKITGTKFSFVRHHAELEGLDSLAIFADDVRDGNQGYLFFMRYYIFQTIIALTSLNM